MGDVDARRATQRKDRRRKKEDAAWYRTRRAMLAASPEPADRFGVYVDRAANAATCLAPSIAYTRDVLERLVGVLATTRARIDRQRWLVELEEVLSALEDCASGTRFLREEIIAMRELHASLPRSAASAKERSTAAVRQRVTRRKMRERRA